jgi:hypothetical protein
MNVTRVEITPAENGWIVVTYDWSSGVSHVFTTWPDVILFLNKLIVKPGPKDLDNIASSAPSMVITR